MDLFFTVTDFAVSLIAYTSPWKTVSFFFQEIVHIRRCLPLVDKNIHCRSAPWTGMVLHRPVWPVCVDFIVKVSLWGFFLKTRYVYLKWFLPEEFCWEKITVSSGTLMSVNICWQYSVPQFIFFVKITPSFIRVSLEFFLICRLTLYIEV